MPNSSTEKSEKNLLFFPCGKNLLTKTLLLLGKIPEILHCIQELFFSADFLNVVSPKPV